jgi:lauroyl/myristoyl acyltransferase
MSTRFLDTGTMTDLIKQLRERPEPAPDIEAGIQDAFSTQSRHSYWSAAKNLKSLPDSVSTKTSFSAGFVRAWSETFHNLAHWEGSNLELTLPRHDHLLIVGWHFPELPLLFRFAREAKILLLVSQDAAWLESLRGAGCTVNVRTEEGKQKLIEQMTQGRLIGATLDHIFPDTSAVYAPLFGRPARTPAGIFELCIANRYMIAFVAPREGGIQIVHSLESSGHDVAGLAAMVNEWLEAEVKRAPERWLMWPSVTARFQRTT